MRAFLVWRCLGTISHAEVAAIQCRFMALTSVGASPVTKRRTSALEALDDNASSNSMDAHRWRLEVAGCVSAAATGGMRRRSRRLVTEG